MILWLLVFLDISLANDQVIERYCYPSPEAFARSHRVLKTISVPSDRVETSGNCLVVSMYPHRRELIQNYLRTIDSQVSIAFSSEDIKTDPCHLKVEKIFQSNLSQTTRQLGNNTTLSTSSTVSNSNEIMTITTRKAFELTVNQDVIKGECRQLQKDRYEITIEVRKDPKPVAPGLPPGTTVVLATPPADQKTYQLKTQIQLHRGNRIELGTIIRDLRSKNHELNTGPLIKGENQNTEGQEKVFLSIN